MQNTVAKFVTPRWARQDKLQTEEGTRAGLPVAPRCRPQVLNHMCEKLPLGTQERHSSRDSVYHCMPEYFHLTGLEVSLQVRKLDLRLSA